MDYKMDRDYLRSNKKNSLIFREVFNEPERTSDITLKIQIPNYNQKNAYSITHD